MPGDTAPRPAPRGRPEGDTLHILTGGSGGGDTRSGSHAGGSRAGRDPGDTANIDSVLGRMVVEQGLATREEVEDCLGQRSEERLLSELLVRGNYVTPSQISRIRHQVEAERRGQQIPGYQVMGKLGAGAMAAVYKARQLSLDRLVAIKVLPRKFSTNKQFIERFYAEGRAAAQLNHPNIVQAYDVGQAGEFHYFVMEYVDGPSVHDRLVKSKRFSEQEAVDIAIHIANALQHAHERGLIHRDVKPKNIMIAPNNTPKLADLGLARAIDDKEAALEEKGKAFGTPYYISPEQIRGEVNIGPQADLYSLGATLYHMVTGTVPYNGKSPQEVMQKHLKSPLIPPDHVNSQLSPGFSEVIEMMMAKSRRDRYKSCKELLIDLKAVQRGENPPNAHKEATPSALAELAASHSGDPAELAVDRSRGVSPFSDPRVKAMVWVLVILSCYALAMTAAMAIGLLS